MTQKSAQGSAKKNHDPKWGLAGSEKKIMTFDPGCEKLMRIFFRTDLEALVWPHTVNTECGYQTWPHSLFSIGN